MKVLKVAKQWMEVCRQSWVLGKKTFKIFKYEIRQKMLEVECPVEKLLL